MSCELKIMIDVKPFFLIMKLRMVIEDQDDLNLFDYKSLINDWWYISCVIFKSWIVCESKSSQDFIKWWLNLSCDFWNSIWHSLSYNQDDQIK